jgi:hypothetical protein
MRSMLQRNAALARSIADRRDVLATGYANLLQR